MSKLAIIAVTGVAGPGVIVGGMYLSGVFGGIDDTLPKTVDELKEDKFGGCVGYLFPKLSLKSPAGQEINGQVTGEANYFDSEKEKSGAACLTVNWEKEKYSDADTPWKGNFRWLWSFVQGDKGLVMFTVASESTTEKQLDLTGIVYLIKKGNKGGWEVDKYKSINTGKKINTTDFQKSFPKPETVLKETIKDVPNSDHWGFLANEDDLEKVCKKAADSTCKTNPEKSSFKGMWLMKSFDNTKSEMKKWSSNIDTLLPDLYTTSDLTLKNSLSNMKGEWKLYSFIYAPEPKSAAQPA